MRHQRKSRQPQALAQQALANTHAGPFGAWTQADLWALPRFPDRDSFATAKGFINQFLLRDGLTYRDLRIALFWLGFGLLEVPTPEEPTMSLVPLCKDLETYAETATELGYDPGASVHERPVCPRADATRQQAVAQATVCVVGPSSSSSSQGSSSSSAPIAAAASSAAPAQAADCERACGAHPLDVRTAEMEDAWHAAAQASAWFIDEDEDPWPAGEENKDEAASDTCGAGYAATGSPLEGGGASSRAWACGEVDATELDAESQVLSYKVKLLHAGGWSSSSGSEGNRTPPTPPASSSAAAAEAGGLNADHVGQFTVTFVSDLQLHEELSETSCLCTFCLDEMKIGEELCRLPCMHTFHQRCVYAWLERDRRCMLCRLDVTRPCG